MLTGVSLVAPGQPDSDPVAGLSPCALSRLAREFPAIHVVLEGEPRWRLSWGGPGGLPTPDAVRAGALVRLDVLEWRSPDLDLYAFDARINAFAAEGPFRLRIQGDAPGLIPAAVEILTRCQRHAPRRNAASRGPLFDRVLARHRALHDLDKPLVRADYDHALDTWQWLLRLAPEASLAAQAAALFHDIERLASEPDARIEHRAADYQAFKEAHARIGAGIARSALAASGVSAGDAARAAELIAGHERTGGDPDLALLNDADALSFFSLNSGGFMDYYGPDHTRRKIAYTLARLRPAARPRLAGVRLRDDVALLAAEALSGGAR